jgi:hypothetical protein
MKSFSTLTTTVTICNMCILSVEPCLRSSWTAIPSLLQPLSVAMRATVREALAWVTSHDLGGRPRLSCRWLHIYIWLGAPPVPTLTPVAPKFFSCGFCSGPWIFCLGDAVEKEQEKIHRARCSRSPTYVSYKLFWTSVFWYLDMEPNSWCRRHIYWSLAKFCRTFFLSK